MLPPELTMLSRALKGHDYYTFSGHPKMCQELQHLDLLLEQIRCARNLSEVHAALDRINLNHPAGSPQPVSVSL